MQRRKEAMRKANEYLNVADMFKLGALQTEQSHPRTRHLSDWAKKDIQKAIAVIKEIDQAVLDLVARKSVEIELLASDIEHTLAEGGRIFLSGCGATGRLALTLERIWRELDSFEDGGPDDERVDSVLAFMAGGDLALVKAIEDFEDHPEYGVAQLKELGFGSGDLLLAITEGGETPFVLGTVEEAAKVAERMPYLLYCNPDEVLRATVERSKRVIDNPRIKKLNLTTGPQVLSGSTRMQASTVQMLSVGLALFRKHHGFDIAPRARDFTRWFRSLDLSFLEKFIRREAEIYKQGEFLLYRTREYGMAVVTDTTERSPTFSLAPFENFDDPSPTRSWAYLSIPGTSNSEEAWYHLFLRPPRTLEWQQVRHIAGRQRLLGYDFSDQAKDGRGQLREHTFDIYKRDSR
ncbi:MAG TPA: hypothetical protein ENN41_01505, partial [Sediminispirochaeta sp.]|nr:hypothetical protein [Sediminispirochaeta sp.]